MCFDILGTYLAWEVGINEEVACLYPSVKKRKKEEEEDRKHSPSLSPVVPTYS